MLSVILLSRLMLITVSVMRCLICDSNLNWLLNLNLIYNALWTGLRGGLLISMLGKLSWFRLTGLTSHTSHLKSLRSKNAPVSGVLIKEKASYFAKELTFKNFQASDGWLEKWKKMLGFLFFISDSFTI